MFPGVAGLTAAGWAAHRVTFFRVILWRPRSWTALGVLFLFRYNVGMEHAPESMRRGVQPLSQTHILNAEMPDIRPCEMQTIYFQTIADRPESLLALVEAEFARRGLLPYATYSTDFV